KVPHPRAVCCSPGARPALHRFATASAPSTPRPQASATAPCPWDCETSSSRALHETQGRGWSSLRSLCRSCDPPILLAKLKDHLAQRAIDERGDLGRFEAFEFQRRAVHDRDRM